MKTIARISLVKQEPNDDTPEYRKFIEGGGKFNVDGLGCVVEYDEAGCTTTEVLKAMAHIRVTADNMIAPFVLKLSDAELDALLDAEDNNKTGPLHLLKQSVIADRRNLH